MTGKTSPKTVLIFVCRYEETISPRKRPLTIYIVNQAFKLEDSIRVNYASQTKFEKKKEKQIRRRDLNRLWRFLLIFQKTANRVKHNSMLSLKKREATPLRNCVASRSMAPLMEIMMLPVRRLILTGYLDCNIFLEIAQIEAVGRSSF